MPGTREYVDAWNPEYGWQLLRRTRSYPESALAFAEEARKAKDVEALELIDGLLGKGPLSHLDSDPTQYEITRETSEGLTISPTGKHLDRLETLRDVHLETNEAFPSLPPVAELNFQSAHSQKFTRRFGDILSFAIPPQIEKPALAVLNDFWNFRPTIPRKRPPSDHGCLLSLTVNLNFSVNAISAAVNEILADYVDQRSQHAPTERRKTRWEEFEQCIRAWDLRDNGVSWVKIGAKLFLGKKQLSPGSLRDLARARYKAACDLIRIFER